MSLSLIPYSFFSDHFKKKKEQYQLPDAKTLVFLKDKVSAEFADFIQAEGFCQYKDGLFSTINPLKYTNSLQAFDPPAGKGIPLVKSAFGDLFYYNGYSIQVLHTSYNNHGNIGEGDAVKYFFTFQLNDAGFHKDFFSKKTLFKKALEQYGKLNPHQSYGFSPLVPKGGTEKLENITIVDTLDYLKELAKCF